MKRPKTYLAKYEEQDQNWLLVDANDQILGRLASKIAFMLQGKDKPTYTPHVFPNHHVVVINASKIRVTGRKMDQNIYYRHSGYTGNLKSILLKDMLQLHPERVIQLAVKGMLPSNVKGRHLLRRLKIYAGENHPHGTLNSLDNKER